MQLLDPLWTVKQDQPPQIELPPGVSGCEYGFGHYAGEPGDPLRWIFLRRFEYESSRLLGHLDQHECQQFDVQCGGAVVLVAQ